MLFCLYLSYFFSQYILKFVHFSILFLYILFTFPIEMRVENAHFCLITCVFTLLILPSEGVKTALKATFSALLITFPLNNVIKLGGFEKFY